MSSSPVPHVEMPVAGPPEPHLAQPASARPRRTEGVHWAGPEGRDASPTWLRPRVRHVDLLEALGVDLRTESRGPHTAADGDGALAELMSPRPFQMTSFPQ